ncbi:MAG: PadR family transcriptional regulator [Rhodospirillaceae bacterium]|nr:PadR family transcriptional regulator [Rhodospirillaceae bacterium]MBT5244571.1 PadR family transcriptional regulator [Rhodospirillaceae bacterium]MBT5563481.1 PadR family transcriptional regulator [Rhodospirillaceae bacterium]MBT6240788.1 PadR family transcriptional regulator [Rhodospirillaceae bacterium]MBT7137794.1 PadR family transcriptional regulator [Rhodospirillaceae bacterium]
MDAKNLCLGALTCGDASGYEIKKMFEEGPFAYFHQVSFGSIYPALAKLCDQQLISMREESQEGRPDKKVYSLTDKGREALRKALKKTPADDKLRSEVMVMFFLEEFLEADHLREVFDQQLEFYRTLLVKVENLDDSCVPAKRLFVRGFGRMLYRSIVEYMEENGHLLIGDHHEALAKTGTGQ